MQKRKELVTSRTELVYNSDGYGNEANSEGIATTPDGVDGTSDAVWLNFDGIGIISFCRWNGLTTILMQLAVLQWNWEDHGS